MYKCIYAVDVQFVYRIKTMKYEESEGLEYLEF